MSIGEIIRQGIHYARTCKSLWLFGFVVGLASGGSGGGSGGGGADGPAGPAGQAVGFIAFSDPRILVAATVVLVAIAVAIVVRYVSEGALIDGVARARRGATPTTREGFRAGWAHWGVLLRIALLYFAATIGSLAVLAAPPLIAARAAGWPAAIALAIPAILVAVPWLITLYLVQAFASRMAVLENRHALDAIRKARLFLHGRLMHGLKLIVASLLGSIGILLVGLVAIVPIVLLVVALIRVLPILAIIAIGGLVLLPAIYVLTAVLGTFRSSVWTIGYVTQVES